MLLAIDAGNTRVKWGLFDANGLMQAHAAFLHANLQKMQLPTANRVVISNVAGEKIAALLKKKITDYPNVQWVRATKKVFDITNHYENTETLGTDRWAALVAAWQMHHTSCVVINAGTTVTIDALIAEPNGASFIGGVILPGIKIMHESLGQRTALLNTGIQSYDNIDVDGHLKIGLNTKDCIESGVMSAILGAIKHMTQLINTKSQRLPIIVLSGGDATLIHKQLASDQLSITNPMVMIDNLVLMGLLKLGQHA